MVEVLLSRKELAAKLAISERTVAELMKTNRITFVRLGRCVRFDPAQVERDLARQTVKAKLGRVA